MEEQKNMDERTYDLSRLEKMVGSDPAMLNMMVAKFLEVTPGYVKDLEDAVRLGDAEAVGRSAHKIKSAIDLVAKEPLRMLVKKLDELAKRGDTGKEFFDMADLFIRRFSILVSELTTRTP
jgi:HPt (histidine-containing phosphotransfer) domain-containing protein